jgi:5-formyltetrahydrofolate cyclo-ligase
MNTDKHGLKTALRQKIRELPEKFSPEKRKSDSEKICARLERQNLFKMAKAILFFAPLPEEVDLWPLLKRTLAGGKMVALPCFDSENQIYTPRRVTDVHVEILSGKFGIREPAASCVEIPLDDLDLILVPGVAFDLNGHRLGRGKGFYDRLLQNFRRLKIGIAFDEQIVGEIPSEARDIKMDLILTPARIIEIAK